MNSAEISNTLRLSLKSRISSVRTSRMFASHTPMIVTASRPDSCAIASVNANTATTASSVPTLCRYSGNQ